MKIAICDDENYWINHIEDHLVKFRETNKDIEWDVYYSGTDLLDIYEKSKNPYDVVIMDIELNDISGIKAAKTIRKADHSVILFFLTNYKEYVFDCFESAPMNFWVKPIEYNDFSNDLNRAYESIKIGKKFIRIIEDRQKVRIKCSDIIFIENKERKSYIHTNNRVYKTNRALYSIYSDLDTNSFVRVCKTHVVNLAYIHIIGDTWLSLYNVEERIPLSRTYKTELIESYMNYKADAARR